MSIRTFLHDETEMAQGSLRQLPATENNNVVEISRDTQAGRNSINVRSAGRSVFVRLSEIEWIEAAANYIKIHTADEQIVVREKISSIEQQLPAAQFVRIHRSLIVSLEHVKELQPCGNGEFVVVLHRAKELPLGRTYRAHVEKAMKQEGAAAD